MKNSTNSTKRPRPEQDRTKNKKKRFLELYPLKDFHIGKVCEAIGIDRTTYYNWMKKDKKFKRDLQTAEESDLDFTESQLRKLIEGYHIEEEQGVMIKGKWVVKKIKKFIPPNPQLIQFKLKTKGKDRGYIDKWEENSDKIAGVVLVGGKKLGE